MNQIIKNCLPVLLLATAGIGYAQITGDLRGTVQDNTGGLVSQAKVTLKSIETGGTRTVTTGSDGAFNFSLLKIGSYEVTAEANGFRISTTQAEVKTGEIATVRFSLEVGSVSETVVVTDAVSLLDAENSQIQTSFVGNAIQEIPVGRNPNLLAMTVPGMAPVSANNPFLGSGSFNSNGGRGRGNNITVDGITATDVSTTGTGGILNPLNFTSIKEVKIITNNFSAEYGRNSSSQVLYITKNGTNELHGEFFEYFRNDKLNARSFFDTSGQTNILRQNDYGWSIGGPVVIPRLIDGRNKFFWQTDFEQTKVRGAGQTRIARVPTPEDAAKITDPTAKALFNQYQIPTSPTGQIQTAASNASNFWQYAVRGDVSLTANDTLWVRFSQADTLASSSGNTFINTNLPGFGAQSGGPSRQATAGQTHLFGSSAVNEFRFGFGESTAGFPIDTPYPLGPRVSFQDGSVATFGVWEGLPQGREQKTYQFNDNFSFVKSRHNVKIGGEFYYLQSEGSLDAQVRPVFAFASFAAFQSGTPATYAQRFGNTLRNYSVKNFFSFVQDDWKITRNLILNLGIRMEWAGGPIETNSRTSNLDFNNQSSYGAAGSGPLGLLETGKPAFRGNTNWAPRFGFAWSPGSGKTVIRGGYGIAYDFIFMNPITNQRSLPPLVASAALSGQNFINGNTFAALVAGNAPIQTATAATVGTLPITALNFGAISPTLDPGLRNPQVHQWSFGLQREQFGIVWKATYVGTKGNFLQRSHDINFVAAPPAPAVSPADEAARIQQFRDTFTGLNGGLAAMSNRIDRRYNNVSLLDSSANSNYHSLQFEAQKQLRTLLIKANYTFGKSIDDGSDALGVLINDSSNQQNPRNNRNNRGPSQFDLRQRVVITHQWEPGWFKGSSSWAVRNLAGNWVFSGITSFRTGFPVTLDAGARLGISPLTVLGGGGAVRPNITGPIDFNPRPAGSEGSPSGVNNVNGQNISAYAQSLGLSQPLLGNFGTMGRNVLRLNGERNFDWTIGKNFNISEKVYFQIRSEFYNIFNNTSFQEIQRNITAPDFGQYNVVGQDPRLIQFAARFVF